MKCLKFVLALLLLASIPAAAALKTQLQVAASVVSPSIDLNFAANTSSGSCASLTACFTVTRASSETCTDASGNLTTATSNTACITSAGFGSTWEGRTNLILNSGDLHNASWSTFINNTGTITVTANSAVAPDGTTTAALVTVNRSSNTSFAQVYQVFTGTAAAYSGSIYLQATRAQDVGKQLTLFLTNGTVAVNPQLVTLTANWTRYMVDNTTLAASAACQWGIGYQTAANAGNFNTGTIEFNAWGGQVELGAFTTPYIPTTGSTAARAADNVAVTGALSTALAASSGTLIINPGVGQRHRVGTMMDSNGTILLGKTAADLATTAVGATLSTTAKGAFGTQNNIGLAWDGSGGVLRMNGVQVTDAQARTPATTFHLGSTSGSSAFYNGNILELAFYSTKQATPSFGTLPGLPGFLSSCSTIYSGVTTNCPAGVYYRDFQELTNYPLPGNLQAPTTTLIAAQNSGTYNASGTGVPLLHRANKISTNYFALADSVLSGHTLWSNDAQWQGTSVTTLAANATNPAITVAASTWKDHYIVHPDITGQCSLNTWCAYYSGISSGGTYSIGVASSSDGINYTDSGSNPVITTQGGVTGPGVIGVLPIGSNNNVYAATNNGTGTTIVYFTCPIANSATCSYGGVALPAPALGDWDFGSSRVIDPFVSINQHGFYEMCYTAIWLGVGIPFTQQIGYAVSADGVTWYKYQPRVLLTGTTTIYTGDGDVFEDGTTLSLLYTLDDASANSNGYALSGQDF